MVYIGSRRSARVREAVMVQDVPVRIDVSEWEAHGVAVIAVIDGDEAVAGASLRDAILGALLEPDARAIIDLSAVTVMNSAMLSALVSAASTGGPERIAIVCPQSHRAREMFSMTALDATFAVCETRAEAARALTT